MQNNWRWVSYVPVYAILLFFLLVTLIPVLWIALASLKTNEELMRSPFALPEIPQYINYLKALSKGTLYRLFLNSLLISTVSTMLCLLVASMASYAIRQGGKWSQKIYVVIIVGIFLPTNSLLVPYFLIAAELNLINTHGALITTYTAVGLPLSLLLVYGFVRGIPNEIIESAEMDGCGFYQTFVRILLPLIRPGLATAAIFQFLFCWNEYIFALILSTDDSVRTMQVGISLFRSQYSNDFVTMFAAIICSIIPVITLFIMLQKQIISGLTSGAVKG
jgi:raffinose/stachyose/melibiose transport system permease protein